MNRLSAITDLQQLLHEEVETLSRVYHMWQKAKKDKRWEFADYMRAQFYMWDTSLSVTGIWLPIFEDPLHRQKRAFLRMWKYQVDVYPWKYQEAVGIWQIEHRRIL